MADELKIKDDSKYRVAFELMDKIAVAENANAAHEEPRAYYIHLYHDCYKVVNGLRPDIKKPKTAND